MKFNSIFFVSIVLLASCRTSEDNNVAQSKPEPESIHDYFNFIKHERCGNFLVQSMSGMWGEKGNGTQLLNGFFTDKNGNRVKGGNLTFGSYLLSPVVEGNDGVDQYGYQLTRTGDLGLPEPHAARDLFGKTMAIRLEIPTVNAVSRVESYTVLTDSLYVPKEIEAVAPRRLEGDSTTFVLQEGFNLRWNVDDRNLKGVVIYLEYDPEDLFNYKFQDSHPKKKHKAITVKDTPEGYTFRNSDLADFANNSVVTIRLGRANYISLKNGGDNYDVSAFTMCHSFYSVKVK